MKDMFWILSYPNNRLLGPFTCKEVLVSLRLMAQLDGRCSSFDIMEENTYRKEIVTADFTADEVGAWQYNPCAKVASETEMNIKGLRTL